MKKIWIFSLLFLFLTGCGWGGAKMEDHVSLTLTTDKTIYQAGEPLAMSLVVFNQGDQPEKITFSSSKEFDFVLAAGEQTAWKWSAGKMFAQSLRTITLTPEKPLVYLTVFNPSITRQHLQAGRYQLTGSWITMDKTFSSEPVTVEIR